MSDEGMSAPKPMNDANLALWRAVRFIEAVPEHQPFVDSIQSIIARLDAAERERDALANELGTTKRAFARSLGENPDVMAALQAGIAEGLATGKAERDALREALRNALASLVAATSLLERGGKKAAPSDKMFAQMLVDYNKSAAAARAALTANHSAPVVEG